MRFPYFKLSPGNFAPIIPLILFHKGNKLSVEAYIDSGATYSIFDIGRADILGIDYKNGKKLYLTVGDGGMLEVYIHKLKAKVGDYDFTAEIGFSPGLGVGFNLLGRKGFFDTFRVCFNDKYKMVDIVRV